TRFSRDWSSDVCSSDLLAGDVDMAAHRVMGDAVQIPRPPPGKALAPAGAQIEPAPHLAARQVDQGEAVAAEDSGPEGAVDHLQLVETLHRLAPVRHREGTDRREAPRIEKAQGGAAIAEHQVLPVPGKTPALPPVGNGAEGFEV